MLKTYEDVLKPSRFEAKSVLDSIVDIVKGVLVFYRISILWYLEKFVSITGCYKYLC